MEGPLMREVLFIGAGAPWRLGAGFMVRQHMFLTALAERCNLHCALFDYEPWEGVPSFDCDITSLPMPKRLQESRVESAMNDVLSARPMMLRGVDPEAARQIVTGLHPNRFDAVFAYRVDFAFFAGVLRHQRLLLDIDDPEHLRRRNRLEVTGQIGDWGARADLARLRKLELRAVRHARAAFVCSTVD